MELEVFGKLLVKDNNILPNSVQLLLLNLFCTENIDLCVRFHVHASHVAGVTATNKTCIYVSDFTSTFTSKRRSHS